MSASKTIVEYTSRDLRTNVLDSIGLSYLLLLLVTFVCPGKTETLICGIIAVLSCNLVLGVLSRDFLRARVFQLSVISMTGAMLLATLLRSSFKEDAVGFWGLSFFTLIYFAVIISYWKQEIGNITKSEKQTNPVVYIILHFIAFVVAPLIMFLLFFPSSAFPLSA